MIAAALTSLDGERSDLNNYRPISTIPVVVKVFERIIYDQLYNYLTENNLVSSCQLAVFILEDALSVWTNLGKHLLLDGLCVWHKTHYAS